MRTSNKKSEKIIKTFIYTVIIIFVLIFIIKTSRIKESKDLIIDLKSIMSMIENNKTSIIYDYIKNRDRVYVLYAESDEDKKYISKYFPSIKFIGKFKLIFYSLFFKNNIIVYASDDKLIDKLRFFKIHYIHVVLNINDINSEEYLTLRDSNNTKIFLSITNKDFREIDTNNINPKYLVSLDKDFI
ncbi:thermonuclease family protein, partial [Brachyspira hampsonii]|nr:thermonuclease family protein [Brachyspira hampsonii]